MYLATIITLLVFLIFLMIALLFIYPVRVTGAFNSEQQPDIHVVVSWLNPFLKGYITEHKGQTTLTINLFNKRVYIKKLAISKKTRSKLKEKNYRDYVYMVSSLKIKNAKLYASYGFADPAVTGMLCGAIDLISQYINLDELYNNVDFITDTGYFNISAQAEINAAVSFIMYLRKNRIHRNLPVLHGNR